MDDPEFICSSEFETLIEQVNNTAIINMILQILRIPVTKEFRAYRCGTKPSKPFLTLIVEKAKDNKAKQDVIEKPFSSDDLQMPVAVAPMEEKPEATEEKPVEVSLPAVIKPSVTPAKPTEEVSEEKPVETSLPSVIKPSVIPSKLQSVIKPPVKASGGSTRSKRNAQHSRKIRSHR